MSLPTPVTLSKLLSTTVILLFLSPLTGCRICGDSGDIDYPAYEGSWQRTTRDSGRVGSVFDSAGGKLSQLTDRREPLPADAAERKRHGLRTERMFDPEKEDPDATEPDDSAEPPTIDEDFRNRSLDDIPESKEEKKLREKRLDEINVRLEPSEPPTAFVR